MSARKTPNFYGLKVFNSLQKIQKNINKTEGNKNLNQIHGMLEALKIKFNIKKLTYGTRCGWWIITGFAKCG